jgi:hypothetical protein
MAETRRLLLSGAGWLLVLCAVLGCEDKPQKNPFDPAPNAALPAPPMSALPKVDAVPDFAIDTLSPKIGFERALLEHAEGRRTLADELAKHKKYIEGLDVTLRVDRNAKLDWVNAYLDELGKLGAKRVLVATETRKEFSQSLPFIPELALHSPAPCSLVAMVLDDRGTAVWRLSGGVASKRGKGMAGPDLSMTGETIERMGKSCKDSGFFFVSAAPTVEWGLAYDLAASARVLEQVHFDTWVLLGELPVPGHKIELRRAK